MSVFGVDYAWGRPGPAALKKAGVKFVCRYLSHDTTGKNLTRAEADQLSRAGIWISVVWESTAKRALSGHAAGVADAKAAAAQATVCGMPPKRPVYFAVDFDATAGQQAAINAYLDGAASVIGRDRVGLYAGYYVVKRALDTRKATWAWQTYAWSGSNWDSRAQIQQYSNDHVINGVGLDYDRAVKADYGQWRVDVSPKEEDDVELNDKVTLVNAQGKATWPGQYIGGSVGEHKDIQVNSSLAYAAMTPWYVKANVLPRLDALKAQLEAQAVTIDKLVDALGAAQPDLDALKAAIKEAIEGIEVKLDVPDEADEETPVT